MKMFPIQPSSNQNEHGGSLAPTAYDINSVVQSIQKELSVGSYPPESHGVSLHLKHFFFHFGVGTRGLNNVLDYSLISMVRSVAIHYQRSLTKARYQTRKKRIASIASL